jgi:tRNA(fMet)-specific endonuclease VapC
MGYLIDTDIMIYSLKGDDVVNENFRIKKNIPKSISVISYGEMICGAQNSKYIEKNLAKAKKIGEIFPVINISPIIMETFGFLKAKLQRNGTIIDDFDLLIASTAITNNLILVTNNEKHFGKLEELEIENWAK